MFSTSLSASGLFLGEAPMGFAAVGVLGEEEGVEKSSSTGTSISVCKVG
jgi:hypothetical protein